MKPLLFGIAFMIAIIFGFSSSASNAPQLKVAPDGWKKVSACNISFFVPSSLENLNVRGIDSCVAAFGDSNRRLSIDYGRYGHFYKKYDKDLDEEIKGFKEEFIKVDGRRAQIVTFPDDESDGRPNPDLKYVANMYVVVHIDKSEGLRTKTSLTMTVRGREEKEQEIAKQIFRTVRFQ